MVFKLTNGFKMLFKSNYWKERAIKNLKHGCSFHLRKSAMDSQMLGSYSIGNKTLNLLCSSALSLSICC